jgi:ABC-type bacteriocin/lantibiotic exporter with double-glycine peptidase domain
MRTARLHPVWREGLVLLRRHRRPIAVACLLVVANRVAALAVPTAARHVMDKVVVQQRIDLLSPILTLSCLALALEAVTGFGAAQLAATTGQRAMAGIRRELQQLVLGLPMHHHEQTHGGCLAATIMTDSQHVRYLVGSGLIQLMTSTLTSLLAMGLLFWIDLSLTLGVMTIMIVFTTGVACLLRRVTPTLQLLGQRHAELTGCLSQMLGQIRVVKASTAERLEAHRFARVLHGLTRESVAVLGRLSFLSAASGLAAGTVGLLLLAVGSRAVVSGTMSLGAFVMYLWLSGLLLAPAIQLAAGAGDLAQAVAALRRIAALRQSLTERDEDRARRAVSTIHGAVTFDKVCFCYPNGREALKGLSFHIPSGGVLAIVGPSGSGKSTAAQLLAALRTPSGGRVLIDGCDLASLRRREYRRQIAIVPQDIALLTGTIADNIRYARPAASSSEVRRAGELAHCEEFVSRLPAGYNTKVSQDGMSLSAGQRQRIAIARAVLVDPRILILDEPTSHLDAETDLLLQEALRVLYRDRTVLVIAHRLGSLERAHQVIVLSGGVAIEQGTHSELIARRGKYWALRQAQVGQTECQSPELARLLSQESPAAFGRASNAERRVTGQNANPGAATNVGK